MASDRVRPERSGLLTLAADAFLFAAALDITFSTVVMAVVATTGLDARIQTDPTAAIVIQASFMVLTLVTVGAGALIAWRAHGRTLGWPAAFSMVAGVIVGFAVSMPLFGAGAYLLSRLQPDRESPPWIAIGVLAALVIAFVAVPLIDAIRDFSPARREHPRLDWMRIVALVVVVVLAVIVLPWMGSQLGGEVAEAGIFMVPFALAATFAVLGGELYGRLRSKRRGSPAIAEG